MDRPRDYHIKWSKSHKDNICYHLHVQSKIWYKWTYLQKKNRLTDIENKFTVTKGEKGWGRDKLRVWDLQIQTTIDKIDKQQGPTV